MCSHSRELSGDFIHISHLYLLARAEPAVLSPKDAVYQESSLKCILEIFQSGWESRRIQGKCRVSDFGDLPNQGLGFLLPILYIASLPRKSVRWRFSILAMVLRCVGFFGFL